MRSLFLAVVLAACGSGAIAQTTTGVIEGRVINSATQEPVTNVQITLVAQAPSNPTANLAPGMAARLAQQTNDLIEIGNRLGVGQEAIDSAVANAQRNSGVAVVPQTIILVDNEGRFMFKDLGPGRYNLRATREGYFGPPASGTSATAATRIVTVEPGKPTPPVEFVLTRGGIMSGRVRDPNGQPVPGMQIAAYRVAYNNGRKTWAQVSSKATDDRGEYRMFWLPPGEYYVGVTPRAPGAVPSPQDSWARTFFPSAMDPEVATRIVISNGGESAGIDINIRTSPGMTFKVSGVTRNPYARPNAAGVVDQSVSQFYLVPREPGVLDALNPPIVTNALPANARANGEFEIRNIRPGSYDLIPYSLDISPPAAAGNSTPISSPPRRYMLSHNPVDVRNADVTGLTLSLGLGGSVTGEIVMMTPGPQPAKLESIRLNLRSLSDAPQMFTSAIGPVSPDATGKFAVSGVPPDRYAFSVTGVPDETFVADIRQSGASVFDSGFLVDSSVNPVQIVLQAGGVKVVGTVLNAERKPAPGATVVLVPAATRRQNLQLYKNTVADDSGHFALTGVPPGPYTAFAWESAPTNGWMNAEYLSNYDARGRSLIVELSSSPDVQLDLIPVEQR